jgi:hypothetical protein
MLRGLWGRGGESVLFLLVLLWEGGKGVGFFRERLMLMWYRAERHPLSGVLMPWGYVMLYAPRDDDELEVWKRLVVAGCRFVSGGKELKGVEP